ncbi:MAG: hypothetical protein JXJ17_06920 [Anaerolineae bacterium]|nr:hypothetical protein [Anaerolineae bacterium]
MYDQSPYTQNFVSVSFFEAIYETDHAKQVLLWESRTDAQGKTTLFTVLDKQEVRVGSLQEFLLSQRINTTLSIRHSVNIILNSVSKKAELVEYFMTTSETPPHKVQTKLTLVVDDREYKTEECDTLTDAMWELHEIVGEDVEWSLCTCYDCFYCSQAFNSPRYDDRDGYRCYREDQIALNEVRQKHKFASADALLSGHYFVHAFHTCAAWKDND